MRPNFVRVVGAGVASLLAVVTVGALSLGSVGATEIGEEGCTPGYWRNHTSNWQEYTPSDTLDELFDFPDSLAGFRDDTLLQALDGGGGSGIAGATSILMRAATAAFLNAAHEGLGYPLRRFSDPGNMTQAINDLLANPDRAAMLDYASYLDGLNNLGCPLS